MSRAPALLLAAALLVPAATLAQSPSAPPATVTVGTVAELEAALDAATPGTVIELSPGTYMRDGGDRWIAAADGTPVAPITLRGPREAILASEGIKADYGLHVTGDHWRIEGLSIRDATKGIVLDGSVGTVISGVDVGTIGEEGVHFRMCSSDSALLDSLVHDTGLQKPRFGEGVYVGSANSNWHRYGCVDGVDDTERVRIEGNTFRNISAEGADLKEGVDSGTLRGNTFVNAGFSGENSADSAVDIKSNGFLVAHNVIRDPSGDALDAIQTHSVYEGYGTGNTITGNVIEGAWPGFGIGMFPADGNLADCSNTAPGAAMGLVGEHGDPIECSPATSLDLFPGVSLSP
jgi:hypothetical protein